MRGFPRPGSASVVGVVEVVSAIALLIPGVAIYAALGLALLMIPAAITPSNERRGPASSSPLVLLVLLLTVAWRRDPATTRALYRSITNTSAPGSPAKAMPSSLVSLARACVAVWFFSSIEYPRRSPALHAHRTSGCALITVDPRTPLGRTCRFLYVVSYTVFHYVAFILRRHRGCRHRRVGQRRSSGGSYWASSCCSRPSRSASTASSLSSSTPPHSAPSPGTR